METRSNQVTTARFLKPLPHLPVKNLKETLDYYSQHLGFADEWMEGDKDGGIRRDDLQLLFAEDESFTRDLNNERHRFPLLWFVANIDQVYQEYKDRGIKIEDELREHSYGGREFSFIDINGYYIRIAEGSPSL